MLTLSPRRLCLFAHYDLTVSWRSMLAHWVVLTMTFSCFQVLIFQSLWGGHEQLVQAKLWDAFLEARLDDYASISLLLAVMYLCVAAILVVYDYRQKPSRLQLIMLPITMAEKFFVRLVRIVLAGIFIPFVAYLSADLLRMLVEPLFGEGRLGYIALSSLGELQFASDSSWLWGFLALLFPLHAFFLLCGCFFRRHIMGLSLLTFMGIMAIFAIVLSHFEVRVELINSSLDNTQNTSLWIVRSIAYGIALIEYFIAYRLFTRQQLIGRGLINI